VKREGRGGGAEWRSWGERREASQQARLWAEWHDLCFLNSLDLLLSNTPIESSAVKLEEKESN
jgi:hypothetical protein